MIRVRNALVRMLYNHLGLPVIPNNITNNRPPYPFVDYNVLTLISFNGEGNIAISPLEENMDVVLETQPKLSVSFNSYSRDEIEAYNKAKEVYNYFKHIGYQTLQDEGIVVVDVMEIDNRTVLEVDNYEYRYGLDVIFRFKDKITRVDNEIKTYSIEEKE